MKKFFLPKFTLFILCAFVTYACDNDITVDGGSTDAVSDSLTTVLLKAIEIHSETGDVSHFIIPHNYEYDLIPADPNNPITAAKVELGMMLYHDPATGIHPLDSQNYQTYSCASCHPADCEFQPGIEQGLGEGGWGYGKYGEGRVPNPDVDPADIDVQAVKTPSALNFAFSPNTLWSAALGARGFNVGTEHLWTSFPSELNHRGFDGLETQVFAGLQVHRVGIYEGWVDEYNYRSYFDAAFPEVSEDERYTDYYVALAIAAYERTMTSSRAPFQDFLRGDYDAMTKAQKLGAIVFFDKGACVSCHNSPSFGNTHKMECIGTFDMDLTKNIPATLQLGRSDLTKNSSDDHFYKIPQLYNLMGVGAYGHGSSMSDLRDMIDYCATGEVENPDVPLQSVSKAFTDKRLTKTELDCLEDFVRTGLYDSEIKRHQPTRVMSGFSFPNADLQSRRDFSM